MVYPHCRTPPRPALNAIPVRPQPTPETAERRARHLRLCGELIELGMTLARAAALRAQDDIAAPPPVAAIPGSSAAAIAQALDESRRRTPDYGKLFTHLSRAVRQTMLLETHIAEGRSAAPTHQAPHAPAPHAPAATQPHHETLKRDAPKRETVERLDCALPVAANGQVPVEDVLLEIGQTLGVVVPATRHQATAQPAVTASPTEPRPARTAHPPGADPPA